MDSSTPTKLLADYACVAATPPIRTHCTPLGLRASKLQSALAISSSPNQANVFIIITCLELILNKYSYFYIPSYNRLLQLLSLIRYSIWIYCTHYCILRMRLKTQNFALKISKSKVNHKSACKLYLLLNQYVHVKREIVQKLY